MDQKAPAKPKLKSPTSIRLPDWIDERLAGLPSKERSEFIRTAIAAALDGTFVFPPEAAKEVRELRAQLQRVGDNLNQLNHKLHLVRTGGTPPTGTEVAALRLEFADLAKRAGDLLARWKTR